MGEKYRERYERHFAQPVIHEQDMQHEELLACHPGGVGTAREEHNQLKEGKKYEFLCIGTARGV